MRIRYVGLAGLRVLGAYRWEPKNGYVTEVDAQTAAELLTYPRPDFVLDTDEPLTTIDGIGPQRAVELALAGVGSIADLAGLDEAGMERLAQAIAASEEQVTGWVAAARIWVVEHAAQAVTDSLERIADAISDQGEQPSPEEEGAETLIEGPEMGVPHVGDPYMGKEE